LGGNRGRGQVYPTGDKSNNTIYTSSANGVIESITKDEKDSSIISIRDPKTNETTTETVPVGPSLVVSVGDTLTSGQPLSNNPNVGGFGQADSEIVLQNPLRVELLIAFLGTITIAQIFLVLKKKQFEKVQLAEMNF
jgi:apocytochrome f